MQGKKKLASEKISWCSQAGEATKKVFASYLGI